MMALFSVTFVTLFALLCSLGVAQNSPTASPTFLPAPLVSILSASETKTSVTTRVILSSAGYVYCSVTPLKVAPLSVASVMATNIFGYANAASQEVSLTINGLSPSTAYNLYCVALGDQTTTTSYERMIATKRAVTTLCCKTISVGLLGQIFREKTDVASFLKVSISNAPFLDDLEIRVFVRPTNVRAEDVDPSQLTYPFLPEIISVTTKAWSVPYVVAMRSMLPGNYTVVAEISGDSAEEYEVAFTSASTFTVIGSDAQPPVPSVLSAEFSSNGQNVIVTFDSSTDQGGYTSSFTCDALARFSGVSKATCSWLSPTVLNIVPSGSVRMAVESQVSILPNRIRALCLLASRADCLTWGTVAATNVTAHAPTDPISPSVFISAPSIVGPCDRPIIDLSASLGNGGRDWKSINFRVTSQSPNSSALQEFLNTKYVPNPPTPIPSGYMVSGYSYNILVTLTNFLGTSGSSLATMTVVDSMIPTVSIIGQQSRTVNTSSPLVLTAKAFVAGCDGSTSSSGLDYSWTVFLNGVATNTVPNESRDKSKFVVSSYVLKPASVYEFRARAVSLKSLQAAQTSAQVIVAQGVINSVIAGGSSQSLRLGDKIRLDGSNSYDNDKRPVTFVDPFVDYGLSYSWTCTQLKPTLLSNCPSIFINSIGEDYLYDAIVEVGTTSAATVGSVNLISLSVFDKKRLGKSSVTVVIAPAEAPLIAISSKFSGSNKANSADQVRVTGTVTSAIATNATWSIDDVNVDLEKYRLTPISKKLDAGTQTFNLVLSAYSLIGRADPYVFTLTSGASASSINIIVNQPPQFGNLVVTPSNGTQLDTSFVFVAQQWADDDIPVTFQFGYRSVSGKNMIVQGRSESSYGSSQLPAGSSSLNNVVTCLLQVYDILNAVNSASDTVIVIPSPVSLDSLQSKLSAIDSSAGANLDTMKQMIAITSSVLNTKNCSGISTATCDAFNRLSCDKTDNTCGSCKPKFIGTLGDDNSLCVSEDTLVNDDDNDCTSNNDCIAWKECDIGYSHKCIPRLMSCLGNCSNHGYCNFVSSSFRTPVEACYMGDSSCDAVCVCDAGYSGSSCSFTNSEIAAAQSLRTLLLSGLKTISTSDEPSPDSIDTWKSNLLAITTSPDTISGGSVGNIFDVAKGIVDAASIAAVSYDALLDILASVDLAADKGSSEATGDADATLLSTIGMLDSFGSLTAGDLIEGQEAVSNIQSTFRILSQVLKFDPVTGSGSISVPLTTAEALKGVVPSTVNITTSASTESLSVVTSELKAKLYSAALNLTGNPMRVQLYNFDESTVLDFTLQHITPFEVKTMDPQISNNFICRHGNTSVLSFECPSVTGEPVIVSHRCNGTALRVSLPCPVTRTSPDCQLMDGTDFDCKVKSFTTWNTTCSCSIKTSARRLSSDAVRSSGVLEVASSTSIVAEQFAVTMASADDFNSVEDLQSVFIIILMYGCLWGFGLLGLFLCSLHHQLRKKKIQTEGTALDKKKLAAQSTQSKDSIKQYLLQYVNEVFPAVYRPQSNLSRMWGEIKRHHRYFVLFTADGESGDKVRMLTGIHLLSIQAMLMFMLAVVYDIQYPDDNGKCAGYNTETTCVSQRSPIDTSETLCQWTVNSYGEEYCSYKMPVFTWKTFILLSIVAAMFTAPFNILVDYLCIDILAAPDADAVKVSAEESTIAKVGRRVSVGMRRASAATAQVAQDVLKKARSTVFKQRMTMLLDVQRTVVAPGSTVEAHALAKASVGDMLKNAQSLNETFDSTRKMERQKSMSVKESNLKQRQRNSFLLNKNDQMDTKFEEFLIELAEQRRVLKEEEQEQFDRAWGIDPTGEFHNVHNTFLFNLYRKSAKSLVQKRIQETSEEANSKFQKLRFATDIHIGLELLHLFVLDLLGKDSSTAKIFASKSNEDFRHSMVVTRNVKILASIALVLVNLLFVYFTMLRALQRGHQWQVLFAIACVYQFIIEIIIYETSECIIVNYLIPDLVRTEVKQVADNLRIAVHKIFTTATDYSKIVLNAPDYLFVSTNVAKHFPDLLESIIVRSYHTYLPGEIGRKWKLRDSILGMSTSHTRYAGRFGITSFTLSVLKSLGATPRTLQRITIHSIQPLFVGILFICWGILQQYPYLWSVVGVIAVYVGYKVYRDQVRSVKELQQSVFPVGEESVGEVPPSPRDSFRSASSVAESDTIQQLPSVAVPSNSTGNLASHGGKGSVRSKNNYSSDEDTTGDQKEPTDDEFFRDNIQFDSSHHEGYDSKFDSSQHNLSSTEGGYDSKFDDSQHNYVRDAELVDDSAHKGYSDLE